MRSDLGHPAHPPVSVIMTVLNEARHLPGAVQSVFDQDYPGQIELVVAVGPARDGTPGLARELAHAHPQMSVVDNPTGRTPSGLNLAIAAADAASSVIVRTDGHAQLPRDYVRTAVETLERTGAANVGGMMVPRGGTAFEQAVARAMSSRIGLGSAPFHTGGTEGPADSVYLGVFDRTVLDKTEGYDEHYARAQDWELNYRIRDLGGVVWFDPRLRVDYCPRGSIGALAVQFRSSGQWRAQLVRKFPKTASARYLAAPLATAGLAGSAVALVVNAVAVHSGTLALAATAIPAGYAAVIVVGALATRRGLSARASAWYPVVLVTMHTSWGAGFIASTMANRARALGRVVGRVRPSAKPARQLRRQAQEMR
ncbi:MAG TPA: glycosyltransferase family 2 protein [Jatrophihabitantaceae bacterium]|nr:glycosyltransferase family 2 protein [Jatrophihabitantaceae bacterium]